MSEFRPASRTGSGAVYPSIICHPYHQQFHNRIIWAPPFRQPQPCYYKRSELIARHGGGVRQEDLQLIPGYAIDNNHAYRNIKTVYPRRYSEGHFNLCPTNSSNWQQHLLLYCQLYGANTTRWSPSPMAYQINIKPLYRHPQEYSMETNHCMMVNGGNPTLQLMPISKTLNNCIISDKRTERDKIKRAKNCFRKLLSPLMRFLPLAHTVCSLLSRNTDVATDVIFATRMCSVTGSCGCVWFERGPYGWPGWEGYAWGPEACWQTCNHYQTLDESVTNATDTYPTHYCYAKEDESRCSDSPSSLGIVHPLWCSSAITFIALPLLVTNCLYIYKARHLHVFKKIPALLILFAIVPIFHFIWPLNHVLQPILGECVHYCHEITITTRIVGAIFESVPQFCLQNFVMMQAVFGDVVGIENPFSQLAFLSVVCSLCSISYAVASFLGEDKNDKIVKFIATFITTGVRVTTNSMYGRHSFGLFMYVLPMFSAFIFICICNFLYEIFICPTVDGKAEDNNTYIKEKVNCNIKMLNNTGRKLLMSIVSASCDGFSINGLLASIAFLPWVIWPFVDNLSIGMLEPGFTISVSVLSTALAGMLLNIIILICRRCRFK